MPRWASGQEIGTTIGAMTTPANMCKSCASCGPRVSRISRASSLRWIIVDCPPGLKPAACRSCVPGSLTGACSFVLSTGIFNSSSAMMTLPRLPPIRNGSSVTPPRPVARLAPMPCTLSSPEKPMPTHRPSGTITVRAQIWRPLRL